MQTTQTNALSKIQSLVQRHILLMVGLLFLASLAVSMIPTKASAIVNGEITDQPWSVALVRPLLGTPIDQRTYCSGVLIKRQWVLTAAHCMPRYDDHVIIGRSKLNTTVGELRFVRSVKDMRNNSTYCTTSDKYDLCDLALVELSSSSNAQDANLADSSVLSEWGPSSSARTYGYGKTDGYYGAKTSLYLRRANTPITSFRDNHFTMFATSSNAVPCKGDSGGPLIVSTSKGPRVVGIVRDVLESAPQDTWCKPGTTTSYTKVGYRGSSENSKPFNWIQSVVN